MSGSRTIRVRKRDGSDEPFCPYKLTGAMWRGMEGAGGRPHDARSLADAIHVHLKRTGEEEISSLAVFEMVMSVLRRVGLEQACDVLEVHRLWRSARRETLLVDHGHGQITLWDKTWLSEYVMRAWGLLRSTARIIAGQVEENLLAEGTLLVTRGGVLELMNRHVVEFGLADAVPVSLPARQEYA